MFVFVEMRSTNGILAWMPANWTLLYLPNRSMMYACCCGTMKIEAHSTARTMTTMTPNMIRAPVIPTRTPIIPPCLVLPHPTSGAMSIPSYLKTTGFQ